ncbi:hypothetical protein MTO96_023587 [Rhipicephalus appendiculatus]
MADDFRVSFRPQNPPAKEAQATPAAAASGRDTRRRHRKAKQRGVKNQQADKQAPDRAPGVGSPKDAPQSLEQGTGALSPGSASSASEAAPEVGGSDDKPAQIHDDAHRSLYFWDGKRRIDFILAYEKLDDAVLESHRVTFEKNLVKEGLDLELEDAEASCDGKTKLPQDPRPVGGAHHLRREAPPAHAHQEEGQGGVLSDVARRGGRGTNPSRH